MTNCQRPRIRRSGITVAEVVVACFLLAILVVSTALVVSRVMTQRISLARRVVATESLANLLEQIDVRPFEELTANALQAIQLPKHIQQAIPDANLQITSQFVNDRGSQPSRRIHCQIAWQNKEEEPPSLVEATIWRFALPGKDGL